MKVPPIPRTSWPLTAWALLLMVPAVTGCELNDLFDQEVSFTLSRQLVWESTDDQWTAREFDISGCDDQELCDILDSDNLKDLEITSLQYQITAITRPSPERIALEGEWEYRVGSDWRPVYVPTVFIIDDLDQRLSDVNNVNILPIPREAMSQQIRNRQNLGLQFGGKTSQPARLDITVILTLKATVGV